MTAPVSDDPRLGTTVAGYRIERLLGRGGMGTVYLAEDLALGRKVALKPLSSELSENEAFKERIRLESRLAASIDHANVIPIYEAGQASDGTLFIAMRYVEGADLKQVLRQEGALEPDRAVQLLAQAARGLDAAHARGLIHRDVKPSNVLVATSEGDAEHVYLADFGLTQSASSPEAAKESITLSGSSDYVSPEQIRGTGADRSSDIYALGCMAYECLTGEVPYPRQGEVEVLFAHMNDEPPRASAANPSLPGAVDDVVARAMAKEPGERYGSGAELVDAIRGATTPPQRRLGKRAVALLLGLLAVIIAAAVVPAVLLTGGSDGGPATLAPPEPDTSTIETIAGTGQAGFSGDGGPATEAQFLDAGAIAFDSDGNLFLADWGNNRIRKIDTSGMITAIAGTGLPGSSGDGGPALEAAIATPEALAFDAAGNLYFSQWSFGTVRKIDRNGMITTVAGKGGLIGSSFSVDSGLATEAELQQPWIAIDPDGVLYISDPVHNRILSVDTDGTYTTIAGTGFPAFSGEGGQASEAELAKPEWIAVRPDGSIYFVDQGNNRIRKIDPDGVITTIAGTGVQGISGDGGRATAATLAEPKQLAFDADGNLYFSDSVFNTEFGNRVRRIDTGGIITTVAGTGEAGFSGDGGPATEADLNRPIGLAFAADGSLHILDNRNNRIRKVTFGS